MTPSGAKTGLRICDFRDPQTYQNQALNDSKNQILRVNRAKSRCIENNKNYAKSNPSGPDSRGELRQKRVHTKQAENTHNRTLQGQILRVNCVKSGCAKNNKHYAKSNPSGPDSRGDLRQKRCTQSKSKIRRIEPFRARF